MCQNARNGVVKFLVKNGVAVDLKAHPDGNTVLMIAAQVTSTLRVLCVQSDP